MCVVCVCKVKLIPIELFVRYDGEISKGSLLEYCLNCLVDCEQICQKECCIYEFRVHWRSQSTKYKFGNYWYEDDILNHQTDWDHLVKNIDLKKIVLYTTCFNIALMVFMVTLYNKLSDLVPSANWPFHLHPTCTPCFS